MMRGSFQLPTSGLTQLRISKRRISALASWIPGESTRILPDSGSNQDNPHRKSRFPEIRWRQALGNQSKRSAPIWAERWKKRRLPNSGLEIRILLSSSSRPWTYSPLPSSPLPALPGCLSCASRWKSGAAGVPAPRGIPSCHLTSNPLYPRLPHLNPNPNREPNPG